VRKSLANPLKAEAQETTTHVTARNLPAWFVIFLSLRINSFPNDEILIINLVLGDDTLDGPVNVLLLLLLLFGAPWFIGLASRTLIRTRCYGCAKYA